MPVMEVKHKGKLYLIRKTGPTLFENMFLILVWDDTIFKKTGGSNFLAKLLKRAILDPPPKSRPLIGPQVT